MPPTGSATSSQKATSRRGTSIPGQLSMFDLLTLTDLASAISSQASADGLSRSVTPDGLTPSPSGPAPAPVSPFPPLEIRRDSPTQDTCGQNSEGLSPSDVLQSSLESKLRTLLTGSDLCEVTWKPWNTPWGQCLSKPQARVRSALERDFSTWQSPRARGDGGGRRWRRGIAKHLEDQARIFALSRGLSEAEVAQLSVSPTFSGRLMGYPTVWVSCGALAMQSIPGRRRRLSKQP